MCISDGGGRDPEQRRSVLCPYRLRARKGRARIDRVKRSRKFTVVIERDEEGLYVATVPALRGCHTQAKSLDTLLKRTREVIELCLEMNQ